MNSILCKDKENLCLESADQNCQNQNDYNSTKSSLRY